MIKKCGSLYRVIPSASCIPYTDYVLKYAGPHQRGKISIKPAHEQESPK